MGVFFTPLLNFEPNTTFCIRLRVFRLFRMQKNVLAEENEAMVLLVFLFIYFVEFH